MSYTYTVFIVRHLLHQSNVVGLVEENGRIPLAQVESGGCDEIGRTGAIVEQVIYHGFVSHLYLRRPDGDRLIAFQQNKPDAATSEIEPGMRVRAEWSEDGNHIVRDEEVRASGVVLPGA